MIMAFLSLLFIIGGFIFSNCNAAGEMMLVKDFHFRVEPGGRTCFFESGKTGQTMEIYYQVVDGQHGDLDISLDVIDSAGSKIVSDYKKSENAIIKELVLDGDYAICLDNSFSVMNSKLVFVYVMIEDQDKSKKENEVEAEVTTLDDKGNEVKEVEELHWTGTADNGEPYYVSVAHIADSMSRTLKHVVQARHMLDLYSATKSRDSYLAFEGTFVVDMWSSFQIIFMCVVGLVQVFMIKQLFKSPKDFEKRYI